MKNMFYLIINIWLYIYIYIWKYEEEELFWVWFWYRIKLLGSRAVSEEVELYLLASKTPGHIGKKDEPTGCCGLPARSIRSTTIKSITKSIFFFYKVSIFWEGGKMISRDPQPETKIPVYICIILKLWDTI